MLDIHVSQEQISLDELTLPETEYLSFLSTLHLHSCVFLTSSRPRWVNSPWLNPILKAALVNSS